MLIRQANPLSWKPVSRGGKLQNTSQKSFHWNPYSLPCRHGCTTAWYICNWAWQKPEPRASICPELMEKMDLWGKNPFLFKEEMRPLQKILPVSLLVQSREAVHGDSPKDYFPNQHFINVRNWYHDFINRWHIQMMFCSEWHNIYWITAEAAP